MIYIVWPEERAVSFEQVTKWFTDAIANGEVPPEHLSEKDPIKQASILEDIGYITVGTVLP